MMWFLQIVRAFFYMLDSTLFNFIPTVYDFLIMISRTSILSQGKIQEFADRIQALLGVFMLFKVSFSLITYVINPDEFSDKSKGFASLWKNAIISLIMLILVPYAFSLAYNFQVMILEDNTLANLIFGQEETETNNYIGTAGSKMAFTVMLPFFSPNYSHQDLIDCTNMYDSDGKFNGSCREGLYSAIGKNSNVSNSMLENYILGVENKSIGMTFRVGIAKQTVKNSSSPNVKDDESFLIDYKLPISTVVATVTLLLLITFCMDVALRSVKLSFLQLIAPIPIISYIDPKNGKDGLFKKWYKMCFATYLSLFIRLAALYFGVYIISLVDSMQDVVNGSLITNGWVKIFIVIGVLMFAKQLPKILEGLGFKLDGDGKFSLNPFKKFGNEALGGKKILGAGAALGAAGLAGAVNMGTRFGQALNPNNWSRINPKTGQKELSTRKILGNIAKIPLSGAAGITGTLYRGIRKDVKGESAGKIFADSYGEAMFAKMQRDDLRRKGATTGGIVASEFHRLTGTLDAAQRQTLAYGELENSHKVEVDTIKKNQELLKREKDSRQQVFKSQETALTSINDKISNMKGTKHLRNGSTMDINVKDAQERVDDLKRTNSYYVKAGDARLDANGNVMRDANNNVITYTAQDEARREVSYLGKQADMNLDLERSKAWQYLSTSDTVTMDLVQNITEYNRAIDSQMENDLNNLQRRDGETEAQYNARVDSVRKIYEGAKVNVTMQDSNGNVTFNKNAVYNVKDAVDYISSEYSSREVAYEQQLRVADQKFEASLAEAGLDKESYKWKSNEASHAHAPTREKQPSNFMPSPTVSGSAANYGQTRVMPFQRPSGNGGPPPGGPGPNNP